MCSLVANSHSMETKGVQVVYWCFPVENKCFLLSLGMSNSANQCLLVSASSYLTWKQWTTATLKYSVAQAWAVE
jgi:hypothetical protein